MLSDYLKRMDINKSFLREKLILRAVVDSIKPLLIPGNYI